MDLRLVSSPGSAYAEEIRSALAEATSFLLVTAFASVSGFEVLTDPLRGVLERGGSGRVYIAVDRAGFNTAPVFETLLGWREEYGNRLSLALVLQKEGLMHAKALFTRGPRGARLVVGSANLTRSALATNHELGVAITDAPEDLREAFKRFVNQLPARQLDGPDAREFLATLGLLTTKPLAARPAAVTSGPVGESPSLEAIFRRLEAVPPLTESGEEYVLRWIQRGYLVGSGRRNVDALVLRVPNESLVQRNILKLPRPGRLGVASHETTSTGFGIDLVPTRDAELLRREARRVSDLTGRLSLNLPCFGRWMPASYWEVFVEARNALRSAESLSPARVRETAAAHRDDLLHGGLEREIDFVVQRLAELELLVRGKENALRVELLDRFRRELQLRTPEVIASCVEFRIARQRWAPFEQTDQPFRQLLVDIVQATFSATYRTGDWPRRFRSHPARRLADAIASSLQKMEREADGASATELLDAASTWEMAETSMEKVIEDFRRLVADDLDFPAPDVAALTGTSDGGTDDNDERRDP